MLDIEKTNDKLKELYVEICEKESIYSKVDAIKLFETYDFDDDEVDILPFGNLDNEDSIENDEDDISVSEDILDYLYECSDDQMFMIELPNEFMDNKSSKLFKEYIFSNYFTNEERNYIFQLLIDGVLKHCENQSIEVNDDIRKEIRKFINNCSINDFIVKYATDDNFCKFVFNIYSIIFFEPKNQNKNINKVISLNDLIRKKFSSIHNKNIILGYTNSDSILTILKYLYKEISCYSMNVVYKNELDNFNIEDLGRRDYIKIIMITDYLRMCELKYNEYDELDEIDQEYLEYIDSNDTKEIIKRFNGDKDFAFNIILEFTELNLYCSEKTKRNCKNMKLIKKLNPLYKLDYMKEDN